MRAMDSVRLYLACMRPKQWIKNLIVIAPLIFSRNLFRFDLAISAAVAFGIFCLLSGSVYVFNDIIDFQQDRAHPSKRKRPIASGRLSRRNALFLGLVTVALGLVLAAQVGRAFFWVCVTYTGTMVFYSLGLKHMVVLDVLIISIGFVLRAIAGVEALKGLDVGVIMSPWLLVCTLFLALFLGFNKRRHELSLLADNAGLHRKSLEDYSEAFLDAMIAVVTAATVIAYAIYTIWPGTVEKFNTGNLIYTVPFVVFGLFRYMYLVVMKDKGGSPSEVLVSDAPLVVGIVLWIIVAGLVLYTS
jgi:4-hydroxybenzoate polyprenyltransferase